MPKPQFISPNWIGMLIPDHRDLTMKKADILFDCATFHSTIEELNMEPLYEPLYTFIVECPTCGETGRIAVQVWRMQEYPEMNAKCRKCSQEMNLRTAQALYFAGHMRSGSEDK